MGKKGNPNWGKKQVPSGRVLPTATSFEEAVKKLKLGTDQYVHSTPLREWARRNRNSKFIPESLLQAWGLRDHEAAFHFPFHDCPPEVLATLRLRCARRLRPVAKTDANTKSERFTIREVRCALVVRIQ